MRIWDISLFKVKHVIGMLSALRQCSHSSCLKHFGSFFFFFGPGLLRKPPLETLFWQYTFNFIYLFIFFFAQFDKIAASLFITITKSAHKWLSSCFIFHLMFVTETVVSMVTKYTKFRSKKIVAGPWNDVTIQGTGVVCVKIDLNWII